MVRGVGKDRKTWGECVKDAMKLLVLQPKWTMFRVDLDDYFNITEVEDLRKKNIQIT